MGKQEAAPTTSPPVTPTILPDVATSPHPTGPLLPHTPGTSPDVATRQDIPTQNPEAALQDVPPPQQENED